MTDGARLRFPGVELAPSDPLEAVGALERVNLRARAQHHVRAVFDALDEVARHALCQPRASHQHVHFGRAVREEDRCLSGGVAASDDRDLLAFAELRFHVGGAVHHTRSLEARELGEGGFSIPRAAGDDHRPRPHDLAGGEVHLVGLRRAVETDGPPGDCHVRAELLGLHQRAPGQILAGDTGGESEIVLDA